MEELIHSTAALARHERSSVESPASWIVAVAVLFILAVAFGAPYLAVVALKPIAAELGSERSVPALATALAWLGSAVGGLAMGRIADRIGMRWTALFGAVMIAAGLALAASGGVWRLWIGYGVLVGLLGLAGLSAPAYVLAIRELFPAAEAGWRIPTLLLCSGSGMAAGSWLAGVLYDYFGFYAPAFAAGVGVNLVNLALVGTLVYRQQSIQPAPSLAR
jgi:MFS family permease